jgi:Protein of unknown function (DUF1254)
MGKWLTIVKRNPVSDRYTLDRFGDLASIVNPEKSRNFLFRRWVWPTRHLDRHWEQHYSWHSFPIFAIWKARILGLQDAIGWNPRDNRLQRHTHICRRRRGRREPLQNAWPADYRGVSTPNADTLYSLAWLDLAEPQVFSHPDMGERFYLFEITDLWMTDFGTPGTRTAGEKAASYLITGPGWNGTVPPGLKQIKSATRYMVILGRTYADGTEEDYKTGSLFRV